MDFSIRGHMSDPCRFSRSDKRTDLFHSMGYFRERYAMLSVICRHTFVVHIRYYPSSSRSAIKTHHRPFAENGLRTPLSDASALLCTDPLYFGDIGRHRTNRTFTHGFGDHCSTIKLCVRIGRERWVRTIV